MQITKQRLNDAKLLIVDFKWWFYKVAHTQEKKLQGRIWLKKGGGWDTLFRPVYCSMAQYGDLQKRIKKYSGNKIFHPTMALTGPVLQNWPK
jgi:hypothetical protein